MSFRAVATFAFFGVGVASVGSTQAQRPHIVLVVLDDVGWSDVGYHGSSFPTPHIDGLARDGVRVERLYVQQVCSPTRAALMTGRYPFRTGLQHRATLVAGTAAHLPQEATTLPEALAASGYRTHMIGKWHLGYASWDYTPLGRGFESFAGYLQGQGDYYQHTVGFGGNPDPLHVMGFDFWRNRSAAWDQRGKYSVDFYMDEAEAVLSAHNGEEPLFLYFAHQLQHVPLQYPPDTVHQENCAHMKKSAPDGVNRHKLCAMSSQLDTAIGSLVAMLKARGFWDNTLFWVMSDNGGRPQDTITLHEGSAASNYPLRGGKHTLFEGGVRAASFISGGFVPSAASGTVVRGLLQHVDVTATLASIGGAVLDGPGKMAVDGYDAWSFLTCGSLSPRVEVPLNVDRSKSRSHFDALIVDNWKIILGPQAYDGWWSNDPYMRTSPNRTQHAAQVEGEEVWLFNLSNDEEERMNLAASYPAVVQRLKQRLQQLADPAAGYRDPQVNHINARASPIFHHGCWAPWLGSESISLDNSSSAAVVV